MGLRPRPVRCSWGVLWERVAVFVCGNVSRGPAQLAVVRMVSEHPPLRGNLPVGRWSPVERRNNQPPVDPSPLEVVIPPLESESSVVLPVLRVLCCVVLLLLRPRFLPSQF